MARWLQKRLQHERTKMISGLSLFCGRVALQARPQMLEERYFPLTS